MGNKIPHGHRLHECDTMCPEYHDRGEFGLPTVGRMPVYVDMVVDMPEFRVIITEREFRVDYGENGRTIELQTDEAKIIMAKILPGLLMNFLDKNVKYAEVQKGYDLGDKGIIPDLNRKLGIIKARLWDGAPEVGESTDEVLEDMVGHILLMLAKRYIRGK